MRDIYQEVTNKILGQMERASAYQRAWISPNASAGKASARPVAVASDKPYRGINVPLLWSAGYGAAQWGTYRAWQDKGAQVRKGEKATHILFWKKCERRAEPGADADENGNRSFLMAREYPVFNAEQVDGFAAPAPEPMPAPALAPGAGADTLAHVEAFIAASGARVRFGGDRAFYSPAADLIQMPARAQFVGTKTSNPTESFYRTMLHELGHWTGHATRNARDFRGRFGDKAYAFEELIAEMASAFVNADLGIQQGPIQDHANYLASWLTVLRADKRAIFTAASKAEAAAGFLHALAGQGAASEPDEAPEAIAA